MQQSTTVTANGKAAIEPEAIRAIRALTGLTQEQFGAQIGVTYPTINRWENGHAKPSPLALKQIETLLKELGERGAGLLQIHFPSKGQAHSPR